MMDFNEKIENLISYIRKNKLAKYLENINIKIFNTYKVNAKARLVVFPKDIQSLKKIIKVIKDSHLKYFTLGNGSNVIFNFTYYDGVIIKLDKLDKLKIDNTLVTVGASYMLPKLSYQMAKKGLSGLEFAYGIPGLIGASVAMNAGAYKKDMSSIVRKVKVLTPELEIKTLFNNNLQFAYRDSFFKHNKGYIILEVTLKLVKKNEMEILSLMKERKLKRIETQPLNYPSAGSVFRNPDNGYAGSLIEQSNLKGYHINGATVSTKHANFIVNKGSCSGEDIVKLINHIKKNIKDNYNIDLILEQIIINGDYSE